MMEKLRKKKKVYQVFLSRVMVLHAQTVDLEKRENVTFNAKDEMEK